MTARLAVGASAVVILLALIASALPWQRRTPATAPPPWVVTRTTTAHNVMIVDVAVERLEQARAAAAAIVEPARPKAYDEILIYVRRAAARQGPLDSARDEPAAMRLQWTPRGGFSELVFRD